MRRERDAERGNFKWREKRQAGLSFERSAEVCHAKGMTNVSPQTKREEHEEGHWQLPELARANGHVHAPRKQTCYNHNMQSPKTHRRFACLIMCILLLLAVHGADEVFDRLQNKDRQLQQALDYRVATVLADLRTKANTIALDKSIAKNMTWKLRHSVRKSLANIVDDEQVAIFDRYCTQLWGDKAQTTTRACKNFIIKAQDMYVDKKTLTLTHSQHFSSGNMIVLVGAAINASKHDDYTLIAADNTINSISYRHNDPFFQRLIVNSDFCRQLIAKIQWGIYLLVLLLLVNISLVSRKFNRRVQDAFRYLQNWSSAALSGTDVNLPSTDMRLKSITDNLKGEIEKHVQRAAKIEQQCAEQSKKLNAVLHSNKLLQEQIERQASMMSALQQVRDLNAYFLHNNRTSKSLAQNLHRSMTSLQQEELDAMFAICQRWEHEFSQRHFVNFLGSYHNSDQDQLLTHLQQDLYQLFAVTRSLAAAWQDIVKLIKQIDNCAQDLDKPLTHWEQVLTNSKLDHNII